MDNQHPDHGISLPEIFFSSHEEKNQKGKSVSPDSKSDRESNSDKSDKEERLKDSPNKFDKKDEGKKSKNDKKESLKRKLSEPVVEIKNSKSTKKLIAKAMKENSSVISPTKSESDIPDSGLALLSRSYSSDESDDSSPKKSNTVLLLNSNIVNKQVVCKNKGGEVLVSKVNGVFSNKAGLLSLKDKILQKKCSTINSRQIKLQKKNIINNLGQNTNSKVSDIVSPSSIVNINLSKTQTTDSPSLSKAQVSHSRIPVDKIGKLTLKKESSSLKQSTTTKEMPPSKVSSTSSLKESGQVRIPVGSNISKEHSQVRIPIRGSTENDDSAPIRIPIGSSPTHSEVTSNFKIDQETTLYDEDTNDVFIVINKDPKPESPEASYSLIDCNDFEPETSKHVIVEETKSSSDDEIHTNATDQKVDENLNCSSENVENSDMTAKISPSNSRSGSPTSMGLGGTPSVFRFSEKGTASGRTIAPPKRYLDRNDEKNGLPILKKKPMKDKPVVQTKPRSALR